MNSYAGDAIGSTVESSPSVGLALVDSMAARRIKVFASHAQVFARAYTPKISGSRASDAQSRT
ncbi:hypothetical protein [Bradyrhizobium sp.]|uniref:hypothetical protein n=1 Tax=Bradyrhizobium sp. TaxID=376 RepID=UPI002631C300|nr:hypothetical protein [Bradyrhizobium sp.]